MTLSPSELTLRMYTESVFSYIRLKSGKSFLSEVGFENLRKCTSSWFFSWQCKHFLRDSFPVMQFQGLVQLPHFAVLNFRPQEPHDGTMRLWCWPTFPVHTSIVSRWGSTSTIPLGEIFLYGRYPFYNSCQHSV